MNKYEELNKAILIEFPKLRIDNEDFDLPYMVAGVFAQFLLDAYKTKDTQTVSKGFQFIEKMHLSKVPEIRELATIGYLEGIQNVWSNDLNNPELVFNNLGTESKKWWLELNKFWSKKINYVGESYRKK